MVINPASIAEGVVTGLATHHVIQHVDKLDPKPSHEQLVEYLLARILMTSSPKEKFNIDEPVMLQPAPYEYLIDENWKGKAHFCIFFPVVTAVSLFTEGAGLVVKESISGWMQLDLRGRLCSGDATSHPVILSYRDDALGVAF